MELQNEIARVSAEKKALETQFPELEKRRERIRVLQEELPRMRLLVAELKARR